MGFYKFISDWGEKVFEVQRESIINMWGLKEIPLDENDTITSTKSVKSDQITR
jgi:hypothetical protein